MTRKYPIGLQSFRKIREGEYLYIDKTEIIHQLVNMGNYYFLSRPRRFGKSLLVDVLEELFSGSRDLFKGLWIEERWNWEQKHPVIHFNFADIGVNTLGLEPALFKALETNATRLGVSLTASSYDQQFKELIEKAAAKTNVVILIDEYDKPLIDYLDNPEKIQEHRSIMKSFYSVLKGADGHIRFLLLTGVSRFSKISIFSDLNNLNDITIHRKYANIVGITQDELERDFAPEIRELQADEPDILDKLKTWYNGYRWHRTAQRVYNPFSLLKFMETFDFQNYWFATGSPTFLVKQLMGKQVFDVENIRLGEIALGNFTAEDPEPGPLLFQTGYLTIKDYDEEASVYELGYPNREVKSSLQDGLLSAYRGVYPGDSLAITGDLKKALVRGEVPKVIDALNAVIATIPYEHWRADTESIFHIITLLTFRQVGVDVHAEVHNSRGRCDVLVTTAKYVYVIELKPDKSARQALDQILETNYLLPYRADKRKKIALGVAFSSRDRSVVEYLMEEFE